MSKVSVLLARLDGLRAKGDGKWVAKCPAHTDKTPSLAIREESDGRLLIHCFGGCDPLTVMHSVGLSLSDLMPERINHYMPQLPRPFQFAAEEILAKTGPHLYRIMIAAEMVAKGEKLTDNDIKLLWASASELRQFVLAASTIHRRLAS